MVSLVRPDLEPVWYDGSRPSRMDSLRLVFGKERARTVFQQWAILGKPSMPFCHEFCEYAVASLVHPDFGVV